MDAGLRRGSSLQEAVPRQVSTSCTAQSHIMDQRALSACTATQPHAYQQTSLGASTQLRRLRDRLDPPVVAVAERRVVVLPRDMSLGAGVGSLNPVAIGLVKPVIDQMKLRNSVGLLQALLTVA